MAHPGPTSWGTAEDHHLGQEPLCPWERDRLPAQGTAHCPGQECCSFLDLIFPEFQNPSQYFILLEKGWLERECKPVRVHTLTPPVCSGHWPSE